MTTKCTILLGQLCTTLTEPPPGKPQTPCLSQLLFADLWGRELHHHKNHFSYFSAISPLQLIKDSGEQAPRQAMLQVATDFGRTGCASGFGWGWTRGTENTRTPSVQHSLLRSWTLRIRKQQSTPARKGSFQGKQLFPYSSLALWADRQETTTFLPNPQT